MRGNENMKIFVPFMSPSGSSWPLYQISGFTANTKRTECEDDNVQVSRYEDSKVWEVAIVKRR